MFAQGGAVGLGREGKFLSAKSNTEEKMWILQEKLSTGEGQPSAGRALGMGTQVVI